MAQAPTDRGEITYGLTSYCNMRRGGARGGRGETQVTARLPFFFFFFFFLLRKSCLLSVEETLVGKANQVCQEKEIQQSYKRAGYTLQLLVIL